MPAQQAPAMVSSEDIDADKEYAKIEEYMEGRTNKRDVKADTKKVTKI